MERNRVTFIEFSAEITGYSVGCLEGTGLVDCYSELLEGILRPDLAAQFYGLAEIVLGVRDHEAREAKIRDEVVTSELWWPVVSNLISLWYLGEWTQLPDTWYTSTGLRRLDVGDPGYTHVPSELAYIEQLSYRTAGAHAPGAKPTGYGSWSIPPID